MHKERISADVSDGKRQAAPGKSEVMTALTLVEFTVLLRILIYVINIQCRVIHNPVVM